VTDQLLFLVIVGTTVWVGFDAQELEMRKGRLGGGPVDMGTRAWVVCCLLLWVIAFPCYLVARSKYVAMRDAPASPVLMPASPFGTQPVAAVEARVHVHAAPPQLSADGYWWWDGTQWTPAASAVVGQG
jgi:hypothetical protein